MGFHSGWFSFMRGGEEQPRITWGLLKRVFHYATSYRWQITIMLFMILLQTGINLITPLILRTLIDNTIPQKDLNQLVRLAIAMLLIPVFGAVITIINRRLNSSVGEGVIYDLRVALYSSLQRMTRWEYMSEMKSQSL